MKARDFIILHSQDLFVPLVITYYHINNMSNFMYELKTVWRKQTNKADKFDGKCNI